MRASELIHRSTGDSYRVEYVRSTSIIIMLLVSLKFTARPSTVSCMGLLGRRHFFHFGSNRYERRREGELRHATIPDEQQQYLGLLCTRSGDDALVNGD